MNSFSSVVRCILKEILIGMLKINERKKHADDEKDNLSESLRRINSSSQDGTELEICGDVNCVEEVHSRIRINHFRSSCGEKRRTAEMTGRTASWWAAFGFSLCSLSLKYSKPVLQAQPPHSLWLSIIAMLSFTLFACAATVMLLVGARYYNNAYYAKVGGITKTEMNFLELDFVFGLGFHLNVTPGTFQAYCVHLQREMLVMEPLSFADSSLTLGKSLKTHFLCFNEDESPHQKQQQLAV